jgi:hypothetical protein
MPCERDIGYSRLSLDLLPTSNGGKLLPTSPASIHSVWLPPPHLKERTQWRGHVPKDFPDESNLYRFQYIPSSDGPVVLSDGHKKQLGFRCVIPEDVIARLEETEHMLPAKKAKESGRGKYVSRHYAIWGDCMRNVEPSREYKKDCPHSKKSLDANKALWKYLSQLLRQLEPDMYRTATNFGYLLKQKGHYTNFESRIQFYQSEERRPQETCR